MRFLSAALILSTAPAFAFEPGSHGDPLQDQGYFVGCYSGEEGGSACEIHASGAIFLASSEGPSEPEAMNALAALPAGSPVSFTGDMISMGDVTVDLALNSVAPNPDDEMAPLVAALQGSWAKDGATVEIIGLEWDEIDTASYMISLSTGCTDGPDRGTPHLNLYQMGGDPFESICLEVVASEVGKITLRDVDSGSEVLLTR